MHVLSSSHFPHSEVTHTFIGFCPQAKLSMIATERDFAMSEMKQMAEQCQNIAGEFEHMATHCDQLLKDLEQVRSCDCHVRSCDSHMTITF